jgi:hypothetical protein
MRRVLVGWSLVLLVLTGCSSGRSTVKGKVTYEDGSPVESGTIIAEATVNGKLVGVQGMILKDGSFEWGADQPGDGALPGQYRVKLIAGGISDYQASLGMTANIEGKYASFDSSGLSFEVKPGPNEYTITITKPKDKSKDK